MRPLTPDDVQRHAEMLANRVRKNHRRLAKRFERASIGAFRLYDRDIPEVRAVVDWYEGHLVIAEYERAQTSRVDNYVQTLGAAAASALGIPDERVFAKARRTGRERGYGSRPSAGVIEVRERELRFKVRLGDYLDTGLFGDHRETRRMVGERAAGKTVLNLFAYTGAFTCWAAHGGARRTVSVDARPRYVEWTRENLELNRLDGPKHVLHTADVANFLQRDRERYDLIVVDPPSRSTRYGRGDFDVVRDHPALLRSLARRLAPGGEMIFSTNHQRFTPRFDGLPFASVEEMTERTVPEDYRNRTAHRCFWFEPAEDR